MRMYRMYDFYGNTVAEIETSITRIFYSLQVFAWKQLENLYFRDKKFSIEVHDPKR